MRVLVTGASGQLGSEIVDTIASMGNDLGEISECYRNAEVDVVDHDALDVADGAAVNAWFASRAPYDIVFNCAAFTDVDGCEADEDAAFASNALGPENLARACEAQGAVFVHVSTDYVFPGDEPGVRCEADPAAPLSAYGRTKLEGERRALAANPRTHVVRTAWLYGSNGHNFVRTMESLGARLAEVTVVHDQVGNPTSVVDLAWEILHIALSDFFGIWHATCQGECSWADLAEAVMEEAGLNCRVVRCTSAQWKAMHPEAASRPAYSSLDNERLRRTIGDGMRPWREALASFMARRKKELSRD